MAGPSAAARRTTGLGTRSRISDDESGSKLAESDEKVVDVDGMRDDEVTSEGGAGEATAVSFSFLTGVAVVEDGVVDDMAGR